MECLILHSLLNGVAVLLESFDAAWANLNNVQSEKVFSRNFHSNHLSQMVCSCPVYQNENLGNYNIVKATCSLHCGTLSSSTYRLSR